MKKRVELEDLMEFMKMKAKGQKPNPTEPGKIVDVDKDGVWVRGSTGGTAWTDKYTTQDVRTAEKIAKKETEREGLQEKKPQKK